MTTIPFYNFGGEGPVLHFAHANGYPPPVYSRLLVALAERYRVLAMATRPLWPGSDPRQFSDWRLFTDDLIHFLDGAGLRDVIGVGHSLGGVTTMVAAIKRPDLFRALVLIEPVFLAPAILALMPEKLDPAAVENFPLVRIASRRRRSWAHRRAAFDHLREKRVFGRWSDAALWDYTDYAMRRDEETGEVSLIYPPEWEARIYALPPRDVWQMLPKVKQPTLALRGAATDTIVPAAWQLWQALQPKARFVEVPGVGHLLPMEEPDLVSTTILRYLEHL